jgi:hypothetical protein
MNRDIIYGWLGGHMVRRQRRTALLDPASAALSNRQYSGRGGRQHSRSPAQRASTVSATRHTPFLIRYAQLEISVNHSKQTLAPIFNPQMRREYV